MAIDDALPDKQVLSLAVDGDTVYAGTGMGVAEIRGGRFERVVAPGYFAQSLLAAAGTVGGGFSPISCHVGLYEIQPSSM